MTVIRVNVKWKKDVDTIELSNEYMEILREIRCFIKELLINQKPPKQQLNFIVGMASYAFGKVVYA